MSQYCCGIQVADFFIGCISGVLREYDFSKILFKNYIFKKIRRSAKNKEMIGYGLLIVPNNDYDLRKEVTKKLVNI